MSMSKRYDAKSTEARLSEQWEEAGVYRFQTGSDAPVYAIDTPPPSVSGNLHLGHCYSYAHTDFFARYRRMRGENVFYPMGFDDNGLPTERLVERVANVRAAEVGRQAFIHECLVVSEAAEREYEALWRRLGLSIDWSYTYRTIDVESRRIAQWGFLELLSKGLAYRRHSPGIWCPECGTAIAQAELNDLERESTFYTIAFGVEDGQLPIATTRPELLPACVAVFVHPADERFGTLIGREANVPLFNRRVPIMADEGADPTKGTGAVMCCTFGDAADINWWRAHNLPSIAAIGRDGRMTEAAGEYAGFTTEEARHRIATDLENHSLMLAKRPIAQIVRIHERCDTPVEYIISPQWFVNLLEHKAEFLQAGDQITWYPDNVKQRYQQWVENLNWDWCISRQRTFGVPFPVWYCTGCDELLLPEFDDLPVDPLADKPTRSCTCGSIEFKPESDVMDTWATSSLTPQIVGRMLAEPALYQAVFPMALRPQAHEIIRTWAFYTIVRSLYHTGTLPWRSVAISGWGLAADGAEKLSKSRGGGPMSPMEMVDRYSADAVRYWAASTALGKDATINEARIQAGDKWANKLWNVARFSERFLTDYSPAEQPPQDPLPADRWMLARLNQLIGAVTAALERYDYATAKSDIEEFFWRDLADNYLELAKKRLYDSAAGYEAARFTLYHVLLTTIKMMAPFMPYVTEAVYQSLFTGGNEKISLHRAAWPAPHTAFQNHAALDYGRVLLDIATGVRRFKSERNMSLGTPLAHIRLAIADPMIQAAIQASVTDLISITRAGSITVVDQPEGQGTQINGAGFSLLIEA